MSLSAALSVALSGMQASTTAAQIIAGNISNAKTAGYTEKTVNLSQNTTGNSLGGVLVSGYSRVSDTVLASTYNDATSNSSYLSTQNGYLTQVQSILDSSSNPPALSSAVANFQSAWTQLAAAPENATQQKSVISAGQMLASTINTISSAAATLQTQVQTDLSTTIATFNADLAQVQTLNIQISSALANSQPIGNLQDQRDQAINAVAGITNVQIMQRSDGQIALYTPGGTALVDGQAQVFSLSSSGISVVNAVGADVSQELTGGKLQAQTDFLSTTNTSGNGAGVITKIHSQIQNFANMFVSTASGSFASIYNSATTGTGEQGSSFFTASTDSSGLPDLSSFAVNASLVSGATNVKQAAATGISNAFSATNLAINTATSPASTTNTFTATGIIVKNQTYAQISNSILSGFQQAANTIQNSSATATTQQTYYQNALSAETGVNTDTELVNLTNWQNSYAASAHIISTIQSMFQTLENLI